MMKRILLFAFVVSAIVVAGCGSSSKDEASSSAPVGDTTPTNAAGEKASGSGMQSAPVPTPGPTTG